MGLTAGFLCLLTLGVQNVRAGFGISPISLENNYAFAGSHFEKIIYLSKAETDKELQVTVKKGTGVLKDWVKVTEGDSFIFPKGLQQMPVHVVVDVPKDARLGDYVSSLSFSSWPTDLPQGGGIVNVLELVYKMEVKVVSEPHLEMDVRSISIAGIEQGQPLQVSIKMENKGNIPAKPTEVSLHLTNDKGRDFGTVKADGFAMVDPFSVQDITGVAENTLRPGQYLAEVSVSYGDKVLKQEKLRVNVYPHWGLSSSAFKRFCSPLFLIPGLSYLFGAISLLALILIVVALKKSKKIDKTSGGQTP